MSQVKHYWKGGGTGDHCGVLCGTILLMTHREIQMFGHKRNWVPMAIAATVLSGVISGCGPSAEQQQRIADLEQASAQKDSLLVEMADLGRFISNLNAELSDVSLEGAEFDVVAESPVRAERDSALAKIRYLNERVDESETRLAEGRRRIRSLSLESDTLEALLAETIRSYERTIENHRLTIVALTEQVESLELENTRLAASVDTLAAAVDTLQTVSSTVYYVIGTKDELLERGVIEKEGGSRVLFIFGKRGETLVPARELDPTEFTAIDMHAVTAIPLPDTTVAYTFASRHPIADVEATAIEDGEIRGDVIEITSPESFWKTSKYLIIVRG